jgi:hypothetical protein
MPAPALMLVLTFMLSPPYQLVFENSPFTRANAYFAPSGSIVTPRPALSLVLIFTFSPPFEQGFRNRPGTKLPGAVLINSAADTCFDVGIDLHDFHLLSLKGFVSVRCSIALVKNLKILLHKNPI